MSSFEIFEDRENTEDLGGPRLAMKRSIRSTALVDKSNEIAVPNDRITAKDFKSALLAYKDDNFLNNIKENEKSKENSNDEDAWMSSASASESMETSAASFTYRKDTEDQLTTPQSVVSTPWSTEKSAVKNEQIQSARDLCFDAAEYQKDILQYLKIVENHKNIRPRFDYMKKQPDINDSMRSILVDWLVEVSEEYRLQNETLSLAVHYIDRFLSYMSVVRGKLQLVGTSAMFIAAKYEEIYPPEITEFVYITDDTYTKQQVLRMEKLLLKVLSFDLNSPTAYCFINLFATLMNIPEKVKFLAQYLCELSMLRAIPFLSYSPSTLSAAAIALSYYTIGNSIWNSKMQNTFGYELEDLREVLINFSKLHIEAEMMPQQAIQEKYKTNKYLQVSSIKPIGLTSDDIDEFISKLSTDDVLNTTAENIESVRQKTEMLLN